MNTITPEDSYKIIQSGEVKVIDVRTADEFASGGIEKGGQNVDIYGDTLSDIISEISKVETYIVVCKSGARSAQACDIMQQTKHYQKNTASRKKSRLAKAVNKIA